MIHAYRPVSGARTATPAWQPTSRTDSDDPNLLCFKCYLRCRTGSGSRADTLPIPVCVSTDCDAMLDELEDDLPW